MWIEFGFIGLVIILLTYMASKNKTNNVSLENINLDSFIDQLAKAIGKEIAKHLSSSSTNSYSKPNNKESLSIDERIIPMKIETNNIESNMTNMAKEEKTIDKTIADVKAKLAAIKKGK